MVILAVGLGLGAWTLLMRLRFSADSLSMTVGPLRRTVDLSSLESVSWKMTGTWRSKGTIFVRDRHGQEVPIYVGRYSRSNDWGPLLLDAARRSGAHVDSRSEGILRQVEANAETRQ